MKIIFATLILSIYALYDANAQHRMSLGLSGNFGSNNRFGGELYVRKLIHLFRNRAEFKAGMATRNYPLSFDGVGNLQASSFGLFGDVAVFPFRDNGLFVGVRLEPLGFNWLVASSVEEIKRQREYEMPLFFLGANAFFQAGYRFGISEKFALRLYGQPGVRYFFITNGDTSINGGQVNVDLSGDTVSESIFRFVYNINLGIEFRL